MTEPTQGDKYFYVDGGKNSNIYENEFKSMRDWRFQITKICIYGPMVDDGGDTIKGHEVHIGQELAKNAFLHQPIVMSQNNTNAFW